MNSENNRTHVMHLLLDNSFEWPLVENLITGLDSTIFQQTVCYICGDINKQSSLLENGIDVINLGFNKSDLKRLNFSLIKRIAEVIKNQKTDIIHSHRHKPTVYGAMAVIKSGTQTRIVTTVHGRNRTRSLNRRLLNLIVLNKTSRIIAVSKAVREDICKSNWLFDTSKVVHVYNGIDTKEFNSLLTKDNARSQLNLPNHKLTLFGTIGRLTKVKAQSLLLKSFAKIHDHYPDTGLVIAGTGQLEEELKSLANELGLSKNVFFLGFRKDISKVLRSLDFFVLPSLSEGHPLVLLEAMSAGIPVIASNVGGIPEIFYDPHPARLIKPGSIDELVKAMEDFYNLDTEQKETIGQALQKRVNKHYTVDKMVSSMTLLYQNIN